MRGMARAGLFFSFLFSSFSIAHQYLMLGQSAEVWLNSFVLESGFSNKIHWTAMATNIEYNLFRR